MKIIVIGDGKVGTTIIEHTCKEGHEVTVIDNDADVIEEMVNKYDVMGICGNGASYDIQKEAGVEHADLVIAATSSDEINILACMVANKLGATSTIARVRNYEYNNQVEAMRKDFGLTMTINPELEAAKEIENILNFPEAIRVDEFAEGKVELVELYVPDKSPLVGLSLRDVFTRYQVRVLVCAVQRGDDVMIPTGNFTFCAKDRIHITGSNSVIKTFLNKVGLTESKIKNILIIGGSKVGAYLAEELLKSKFEVKIIEQKHERCLELAELLPKATIIEADGSDQTILDEEGISNSDAIACLTGMDEQNIIISMYANKLNVPKIITKIDKASLVGMIESIGDASVIAPKEVVASKIVSYVRAMNNKHGSNIVTLYKLVNNQVEALEFIANSSSKVLSTPLKDLKLKENVLIASIIRNNEVIVPSGLATIETGDRIIVVTAGQYLDDLDDILR